MDIVKRERTLGRQDSKPIARTRKVKLWTRLSPLYLFRVLRDTYVRGCVTFGNSSKVNAVAHSSAFRITSDENSFSRSNSRNLRNDHPVSAQEILDLSAKFSREVLEQESVQSGRKHLTPVITGHNGLTLADLQGYAGHSGPLRKTGASGLTLRDLEGHSGPLRVRPSFDSVPESEQYTDSNASKLSLEALFQTSAIHPTNFLQSPSRRVAALSDSYQLGLPPRNSDFARVSIERPMRRLHARYASASISHIPVSPKPLTPVTDMSTFREQSNGRKSYDLPRASSRRRERFGSMNSASMHSLSRPVTLVDDLPRSRSGKSNRPNPYSLYDTRLPSPALTV
ncbi:hypothetical protein KC19_7G094700 [Ceratodon purpureus]|uniref:Uncharacterized protein n=1 Tax=Ceratodon purpureus TaxID=3225 RepID=A0A8T0H6L8_CERPU|nr:hypothetical protein KC19_7G094700 [Ceratodon purpureus]